jgi:hypothetical protein
MRLDDQGVAIVFHILKIQKSRKNCWSIGALHVIDVKGEQTRCDFSFSYDERDANHSAIVANRIYLYHLTSRKIYLYFAQHLPQAFQVAHITAARTAAMTRLAEESRK